MTMVIIKVWHLRFQIKKNDAAEKQVSPWNLESKNNSQIENKVGDDETLSDLSHLIRNINIH